MRTILVVAAAAAAVAWAVVGAPTARGGGDVKTEVVEYRHGDVVCEGFRAYDPAAEGKRPGVLVVHAWKGLDDQARASAERLAAMGYVAFAADVYGKGVRPADSAAAGQEAGRWKGDRALTRARAGAALDVLAKDPRVDPARLGAIGYCFGGMVVLELARGGAPVRAVVSFHGSLDTPAPEDMKGSKARVLALHGADDPYVPQDVVAAFVAEMRAGGADWALVQYGGAVHSFTDPGAGSDPKAGARYDEKTAARAWEAMGDWFREAFAAP
jgi:dienelactone hydrolase